MVSAHLYHLPTAEPFPFDILKNNPLYVLKHLNINVFRNVFMLNTDFNKRIISATGKHFMFIITENVQENIFSIFLAPNSSFNFNS